MRTTAAAVGEKEQAFSVEGVELDEPRAGEVLVRVVGVGVCHTDLIVRDQWYPVPLWWRYAQTRPEDQLRRLSEKEVGCWPK